MALKQASKKAFLFEEVVVMVVEVVVVDVDVMLKALKELVVAVDAVDAVAAAANVVAGVVMVEVGVADDPSDAAVDVVFADTLVEQM